MINLKTTLTANEAEALRLLLSRMTFDDFLKLTDGDGDEDQAYYFVSCAGKLRAALASI
ncbi:MAG: DUF7706 family protein [Phormidesmis sp.]